MIKSPMTLPAALQNSPSANLAWLIAEAGDDRKADDILILKVDQVSYLTDYFVVMTGFSKTQVRAIADAIEDHVFKQQERQPIHLAGVQESTWILLDYGEVIVHVFLPDERRFYNLEAFWGHGERIDYPKSFS